MKRALLTLLLIACSAAKSQTIYAPQINSDWNATSTVAKILNKPTLSIVATTGNFADLISKSTTLAGYGITDGVTSSNLSSTLAGYTTTSALTSALTPYALTSSLSVYATTSALTTGLSAKYTIPTGTTSQYIRGDGSFATLPGATAFNFGSPNVRTLSFSTDYQATDTTKAAVFTISPSCTNSTTVVAASACTMQTRIASTAVTCSTGTVINTWSSTYALGLLLTNASGSPFTVNLPTGWNLILCATAGTFTVTTAVDQSAG